MAWNKASGIGGASRSFGFVAMLSALAAFVACGKSKSDIEAVRVAGSAGVSAGAQPGGNGGRAGGGVTGGRSGADAGGRSGAGAGGTATGGAAAGRAGDGGVSGAGGCVIEQQEDSLAHCPPSQRDGGQPTSTCSIRATCEALRCGDPWSDFDARGCLRSYCEEDTDCASGERCLPALLVGQVDCHSSIFEGCHAECDQCYCIGTDDCRSVSFCQPASEFPESADCTVVGRTCPELREWQNYLEYGKEGSPVLEACAAKVDRAVAACSGSGGDGGAGGEGGAGAANN